MFELAAKQHARLVLSGDRRQHGSVERGAALRLLEDEAGLKPAELKEIHRQQGAYMLAVKSLGEGDMSGGLTALDKLGWVQEIASEERYRVLATMYMDSVRAGKSSLVVSPTHAEADAVTEEIRQQLREQKALGSEVREYEQLVPANLTPGQQLDAASYQPGDVLVFHQNARGYKRGQRLVVGRDRVPLDQAARFTVFHQRSVGLSVGDRIRITQNGFTADRDHRLNNGDLHTIKDFAANGNLLLENGWQVPKNYGHIALGFVVTSHASQGKTVDRVFIGQSSQSFPASSREQFYVSASRGRERVMVFTDNKEDLLDAISRSDERVSAIPPRRRTLAAGSGRAHGVGDATIPRLSAWSNHDVVRVHESLSMYPRDFQAPGKSLERSLGRC
ncbi:ATP-dependent RecD-like DNA helicase [Leptolyngbya sp. 7M]|uniref:ATP-dependent DNA helicase n=1 Tax=Leptolyngbya sp. 7M TaxID=2812896 RepID=UPI001B8B5238|nr:AAA family ATPase [Leptolyngbya sp. 7M]QYO65188.1 AAA family ATPase [Leptolyngbya sp. 7M]